MEGMTTAQALMMAASMGAQALGSKMQADDQADMRGRQNAILNQQGEQQAAMARQNAARVAQTTNQLGADREALERPEAVAKLTAEYTPADNPELNGQYQSSNPGAPKEVSDAYARAIGNAVAKGKQAAEGTAGMAYYGNSNLRRGIDLNRSAEDIARNNDFAAGSGRVAQQELNAIAPSQGAMYGADLLKGAGGMGALYASRMRPGGGFMQSAGDGLWG
jgi:hypothetical protein